MQNKKILISILSIIALGLGVVLSITFYNNLTLDGTYYSLVESGDESFDKMDEAGFIEIKGNHVYYHENGQKEVGVISKEKNTIKVGNKEYQYIHNFSNLTLYLIKDTANNPDENLFFRKKTP